MAREEAYLLPDALPFFRYDLGPWTLVCRPLRVVHALSSSCHAAMIAELHGNLGELLDLRQPSHGPPGI